eukprot:gene19302-27343_t
MRLKNIVILLLSLFAFSSGFSQEKFTLSGTVSDKKNNETLIGVSIAIKGANAFTTTNEYGFYSLTLPKGDYEINIRYVSYETITEKISLTQNVRKNYSLIEVGQVLEDVVISEKNKTNTRKPEMSVNKLSISTIKQMPVVLGEVDIIKSILFLPGVTNAGEGQSGFNVRGGGADQNLILLDE